MHGPEERLSITALSQVYSLLAPRCHPTYIFFTALTILRNDLQTFVELCCLSLTPRTAQPLRVPGTGTLRAQTRSGNEAGRERMSWWSGFLKRAFQFTERLLLSYLTECPREPGERVPSFLLYRAAQRSACPQPRPLPSSRAAPLTPMSHSSVCQAGNLGPELSHHSATGCCTETHPSQFCFQKLIRKVCVYQERKCTLRRLF